MKFLRGVLILGSLCLAIYGSVRLNSPAAQYLSAFGSIDTTGYALMYGGLLICIFAALVLSPRTTSEPSAWQAKIIGGIGFVGGVIVLFMTLFITIPTLISFASGTLAGNSELRELLRHSPVYSLSTYASVPIAIVLSIAWIIVGKGLLRRRASARGMAVFLFSIGIIVSAIQFLLMLLVFFVTNPISGDGYSWTYYLSRPAGRYFFYLYSQVFSPLLRVVISGIGIKMLNADNVIAAFQVEVPKTGV